MNQKINILVDGMGGDVGQGIVKSVLDLNMNFELFVSCIDKTSSWLYKVEKSYIFPLVNDDEFIDFLINFLLEHKINIYFPTIDSSLIKIAMYKDYIEEKTGTCVFIDDLEKIKICDDKYLTYKFLQDNNFSAPHTINLDNSDLDLFLDKYEYPFILKTKTGNGSNNIMEISKYDELKPFIGNKNWIIQEKLNIKNEITAGVYIGNDQELKGLYVLKRTLKCGSTFHAERIIDSCLEKEIISIAKKLNMKYVNIQAVYEDGVLLPFEFNGRLSGTSGAMRSVFNIPEFYIKETIHHEYITPCTNKEKFFFTRYREEIMYTESNQEELLNRSTRK